MKFIEFLYSLKNDNNSSLIESIGLGYGVIFESKVDFEKYSLISAVVTKINIRQFLDLVVQGHLYTGDRKNIHPLAV